MKKYSTLEAEMAQRGLSNRSLSREMGISEATLYNKRAGKNDFTLRDIIKIKNIMDLSQERICDIFLS